MCFRSVLSVLSVCVLCVCSVCVCAEYGCAVCAVCVCFVCVFFVGGVRVFERGVGGITVVFVCQDRVCVMRVSVVSVLCLVCVPVLCLI